MQQALYKHVSKRKKEEAISYISSYQTLTADKNSESYKARTKLKKISCISATIAVNLLTRAQSGTDCTGRGTGRERRGNSIRSQSFRGTVFDCSGGGRVGRGKRII
jgi:hypothetical protein